MTIKKEIYLSYAFKDSYIKKAEKGKRKGLFWGEERKTQNFKTACCIQKSGNRTYSWSIGG